MNSPERNRESIWSISAGWGTAYFFAFSISNLVATCVIVADEIVNRGDASPLEVFSAIVERVAVTGVALGITYFSIVEALASTMITANYIRQKWLEPLKEQQRAEGVSSADAEWEAWLDRRSKAESDGIPFDEPPPSARRSAT